MKRTTALTITSLLSLVFFALHFVDDIVRGFEPGDVSNYPGVLILAAWLYATLLLIERRAGLAIILLFSIGASAVPLLHMRGTGLAGGRLADSAGLFFWVLMLIAMGATGIVSAILSARALWHLRTSGKGAA